MEGIDAFISTLAAAKPFPGGGSAAALAGALAAALGEMVAGVTEGKEKFASVEPRVLEIHTKMAGSRKVLRALVQEDMDAYRSFMEAMRLPRETEEQKFAREAAIEKSARNAIKTPLRTARAAVEVLEFMKILIEIGNPNAWSDAAVGAQLAYASLKGGQYNVLTNIRVLRDRSFADSCRTEISDLVRRGHKILQQIDRQIAGR
jgi:formiminotetrahydrofolate cyclodeaminase